MSGTVYEPPDVQLNHTNNESEQLMVYDSVNNIDAYNLPKASFNLGNNTLTIKILSKTLKVALAQEQMFYNHGNIHLERYVKNLNCLANSL